MSLLCVAERFPLRSCFLLCHFLLYNSCYIIVYQVFIINLSVFYLRSCSFKYLTFVLHFKERRSKLLRAPFCHHSSSLTCTLLDNTTTCSRSGLWNAPSCTKHFNGKVRWCLGHPWPDQSYDLVNMYKATSNKVNVTGDNGKAAKQQRLLTNQCSEMQCYNMKTF